MSVPELSASLEAKTLRLWKSTRAFHNRLVAETDALQSEADALAKESKALRRAAKAAGGGGAAAAAALDGATKLLRSPDLVSFLPSKQNGMFLRMFLGREVDVCSPRQDARYRLKEEYNEYRDWTNLMYVAFPLLLVGIENAAPRPIIGFLVTLYHAWLLHFYSAVALRENVLAANGTNIRRWWIVHHYYFIALSLSMLTMSYAFAPHRAFLSRFNRWAAFQGAVMLLQTSYQRKRLYTRVALGKDSTMDVVSAEGSGVRGQVLLLFPVLVVLQATEFWLGAVTLWDVGHESTALGGGKGWRELELFSQPGQGYFADDGSAADAASPAGALGTIHPGSGQLVVSGLLLVFIACGNLHATVVTLYNKLRVKRARRSHSRQNLLHEPGSPDGKDK